MFMSLARVCVAKLRYSNRYSIPYNSQVELYGIEYLFDQNGMKFQYDANLDKEIDEGIGDLDIEVTSWSPSSFSEDLNTFSLPGEEESESDEIVFALACIHALNITHVLYYNLHRRMMNRIQHLIREEFVDEIAMASKASL